MIVVILRREHAPSTRVTTTTDALDEIAPHTLHGAKAAAGGAHSGGAPPNAANPGAGGAVGIGGEAALVPHNGSHGSDGSIAERSESSLRRRTASLLSTAPIGVRPKEASDTRVLV